MIGSLRGVIIDRRTNQAILEVQGVGYVVNVLGILADKIKIGDELFLYTHTAVRENDISLYGFSTGEELSMFESLMTVSGIGPKSALGILGVAGLAALEEAILTGNTAALTKIAGVGKKTADKIVLELSGKVASTQGLSKGMKDDLDVFEALKALGYRDYQVKEAISEIPKEVEGANEKIKHALKILGQKNSN
jgi:holliday junction DNA helicase RuvA